MFLETPLKHKKPTYGSPGPALVAQAALSSLDPSGKVVPQPQVILRPTGIWREYFRKLSDSMPRGTPVGAGLQGGVHWLL